MGTLDHRSTTPSRELTRRVFRRFRLAGPAALVVLAAGGQRPADFLYNAALQMAVQETGEGKLGAFDFVVASPATAS